ncbi:hypothetical protein [Mucilaginibacter sp. L196]|uniref:hypothetical protein n=1 Tax=Mucilaginibacter sp. L196 TaxID=1641870 RepID=UPI00131D2E58|nr:hypothetical protein [Mucilaginibacter sp. L196]
MTQIENEQIKQLTNQVENLNSSVEQIKTALLGNEYNKDGGLVDRQKVIEIKLAEHEGWIQKFKWIGTIGIGAAALIEFIYQFTNIFSAIFPHLKK